MLSRSCPLKIAAFTHLLGSVAIATVFVRTVNEISESPDISGAGCAGGLTKNFAALVEVLGGFAEVKEAARQAEEERVPAAAQVTVHSSTWCLDLCLVDVWGP